MPKHTVFKDDKVIPLISRYFEVTSSGNWILTNTTAILQTQAIHEHGVPISLID
jgi:hypothetical protein